MKNIKFLFSFLLFILFHAGAVYALDCTEVKFPARFLADQKILTIGTDFDLKEDHRTFATIEERVLHLATTFELVDQRGQKIASARKRIFTWGATMDIFDCKNQKVGTVKELIWKSLWKFTTQYQILNASGGVIGESEKKELFATNFTFKNLKLQTVMTMRRPAFNIFGDEWTVSQTAASNGADAIDRRLLIFIPAFKTAADTEARQRSDD